MLFAKIRGMIFHLTSGLGISIILLSFLAEYIDSTIGMGYGTTLTPLLILMGFDPLQVVPAVLISELSTGLLAGFTHHSIGNVDFRPKTMNIKKIIKALKELGVFESFHRGIPLHLRVVILLSSCSILGTMAAVILAVNLPKLYLKLYIGFLILIIGIFIVATLNKNYTFSWKRITILGLIASFNKGISGGGYGPVVMGGQLLAGVEDKNAVGITSLAEGLTCLSGVVSYLIINGSFDWILVPYLIMGGIIAAPLSAITVKQIKTKLLRIIIGKATIIIGLFILWSVLL